MRSKKRALIGYSVYCGLMALSMGLIAQPAMAQQHSFQIEDMTLSKALREYGRAAGRQIIFTEDLVRGKRAPNVIGSFAADDALARLLAGSGLTAERTPAGAVMIVRGAGSGDTSSSSGETNAGSAAAVYESADIIVTAQKREENLQDVPISISVLGGEKLDRSSAQGITETLSRVPGVAVSEQIQGGGTQITIRGVSTGASIVAGASTSAYYIDSVPFGFVRQAIAPDPNAYDLERLEVLRGPQGTLYGANALNGVVRILTHKPDLDRFEFKARGSVSSTKDGGMNYRGDIAANLPIVEDKLAVRIVAGHNDLAGWIDAPNRGKNDINDARLDNLRARILARPTEVLTIGASVWRSVNHYGAASSSRNDRTVSSLYDESNKTDFTAYGFDVGYDFGVFSLSSATSYVDYANGGDLAGILFTGIYSRVFAEEIVLSSIDAGAWDWSLGAFYRDAKDRFRQDLYGALEGQPAGQFDDISKSYALFGEVSRRFLDDKLKLTLGLRYFHDKTTTEGFVFDPGKVYNATFKATTPRAVVTWTPNDDLSVYGSYSQGFRSGAYQYEIITARAPFYPPVKPDKLHNYEIGAKGSMFDNLVSFDAALFYIDWKDVQQVLNIVVGKLPNGENIGVNVAINGVSASGLGADLSLTVRPVEGFELGGSFSWNDLTMNAAVVNGEGNQVFAKGDRLGYSPKYTASLFADYAFPIGSGFEGRLSGSVNYTSPQSNFGGTTRFTGDAITIARASFSLEAADHWTAMLYVDNLTDEYDTVIPQFGVPDWSSRPRPRTVGLQLEYHF